MDHVSWKYVSEQLEHKILRGYEKDEQLEMFDKMMTGITSCKWIKIAKVSLNELPKTKFSLSRAVCVAMTEITEEGD